MALLSTPASPIAEGELQRMQPAPPAPPPSLQVTLATDFEQVVEAWQLVYEVYVDSGFVHPNPLGLHTSAEAVAADALVVIARRSGILVSTLTAILDHGRLPLDRVYPREMASLRRRGTRLIEVGLFADRCRQTARGRREALLEIMRFAYHFGRYGEASRFVLGVHPRHAAFYGRAFGFEQVARRKTHPGVNHRPVVLLSADCRQVLQRSPLPFALAYAEGNPIPRGEFSQRYRFPDAFETFIERIARSQDLAPRLAAG